MTNNTTQFSEWDYNRSINKKETETDKMSNIYHTNEEEYEFYLNYNEEEEKGGN